MLLPRRIAFVLLAFGLLVSRTAFAQRANPAAFPDGPGKEVLLAKCFQCHAPTMWRDNPPDRRGWESGVFRMVGRGAPWAEGEIKNTASYFPAGDSERPAHAHAAPP